MDKPACLMKPNNIFADIPDRIPDEIFEDLAGSKNLKIERIISKGHSSPKKNWYDQDRNEWIILLKGSAGLLFKGSDQSVRLNPGDYLNIPAHVKHRVEWTDQNQETIWLAIHYD